MPFSTKQSDVFYNDETKELFVCTVSSVSADRCEGTSEDVVHGALPIIYKINKETNYKKRVYPRNFDTFLTDEKSDLYALTTPCSEGTNFDSITKPLINFNKTTERYSVTFLGRYSNDGDGLSLNNYIFEDIDSNFYLLDSKVYIPNDKFTNNLFTFQDGYINSDLYIVGNSIRNGRPSWFNPEDGIEIERSPDYSIAPMYVQSTSSLGFNLVLDNKDVTIDALSGDVAFPMLYSGGFVTYNPKYVAFDPEYNIRVDFRARAFTVPSPTAYGGTQSVGNSATRWIQQWTPAGAGEGFCVSFFKNPEKNTYIIPNGIGSTLGYAEANFSSNEVAGTAQSTIGLFRRNNWNPNTHAGNGNIDTGNIGGNIGLPPLNDPGDGQPADSFLGIGFDIGGNFASTSEEKPGWLNGSSYTATPCSVGIRGSINYGTQVLTAVAMSAIGNTVPMHTSAVSASFVDYRIDLSDRGTRVTVSNKLTSATDYNTILEFRLNRNYGNVGAGINNVYKSWDGLQTAEQIEKNILPPLNVGLSFTTSDKSANFELHKFEVTGVKINNPWVKKKEQKAGTVTKIDYLQQSSTNLRKKLVNVESDDPVDVEMVIPAKSTIAKSVVHDLDRPEITLCEGSDEQIVDEDVDVKITKLDPRQVDKTVEIARTGNIPKIPNSPTTIKRPKQDKYHPKDIRRIYPKELTNETLYGSAVAETGEPAKDIHGNDISGLTEILDPEFVPGGYNNDRQKALDIPPSLILKFKVLCDTAWGPNAPNGFPRYQMYQSNPIKIPKASKTNEYYIFIDGKEIVLRSNLNTITQVLQNKAHKSKLETQFVEEVIARPNVLFWELRLFQQEEDGKPKSYEERYPDAVFTTDNWSFEPIGYNAGEDDLVNKAEDFWFRVGRCKPSPVGERHEHLKTNEAVVASGGYQQEAQKCAHFTSETLLQYLRTLAEDQGTRVEFSDVFEQVEWRENYDDSGINVVWMRDKNNAHCYVISHILYDEEAGINKPVTLKWMNENLPNFVGKPEVEGGQGPTIGL